MMETAMSSPQLERYAEIAHRSTQKVTRLPIAAHESLPGSPGTLTDRISALIPDLRPRACKPEAEQPFPAWWAAVSTFLWWAIVLVVFALGG